MTTEELETKMRRAESKTLVVSKVDDGFRVYSPTVPTKSYLVSGGAGELACTCLDFQYHDADRDWQCEHILAVVGQMAASRRASGVTDAKSVARESAGQNDRPSHGSDEVTSEILDLSEMLIKRSVSPDGRIDALSVEFSCPVRAMLITDVESRAHSVLELQEDIVARFLSRNGGAAHPPIGPVSSAGDAMPAKMLNIGGMDGKWGRRLFITLQANGRTLRLFGTPTQLGEHLTAAGFPKLAGQVEEDLQLNIPCQIVTRPSKDGRFVDVERVLPHRQHSS